MLCCRSCSLLFAATPPAAVAQPVVVVIVLLVGVLDVCINVQHLQVPLTAQGASQQVQPLMLFASHSELQQACAVASCMHRTPNFSKHVLLLGAVYTGCATQKLAHALAGRFAFGCWNASVPASMYMVHVHSSRAPAVLPCRIFSSRCT